MPINLPHLAGLDRRAALDGSWHGLWRTAGLTHQIWLAGAPPGVAVAYCVVLPLDALFELRTNAVLRFWRALAGRPTGDQRNVLPPQTRERHILILRALDARLAGASYRVIAEALFGFKGRTKNDWEVSPLKNQTRRLVADGRRLVRGGYRELLHYPIRLPSRRS